MNVTREPYTLEMEERIRKAIWEMEKRCRPELEEVLGEVFEALRKHRFGHAVVDAGITEEDYRFFSRVLNANPKTTLLEATYLSIDWYTWRGTKIVSWWVNRLLRAPNQNLLGPKYSVSVGPEIRWAAFNAVFPKNFKRLLKWRRHFAHLKCLKQLQPLGIFVPDGLILEEVIALNEKFRLSLAWGWRAGSPLCSLFLCTPIGCFQVPRPKKGKIGIPGAMRKITGKDLPRGQKAAWENVEPLFVMAALITT